MFDPRLETLKPQIAQYWAERALYQLEYAHEVSQVCAGQYADVIQQGVSFLVQANAQDGAITKDSAGQVEAILAPIVPAAKRYSLLCAAHAHIDMNWMWRWDETVAITLDTFRTMLDLMREYPDFTVLAVAGLGLPDRREHDPEMLEEIRQRVQEGRWEVTASTWVEADKNLPNGESQARHLLYTRRYLSRLLGPAARATSRSTSSRTPSATTPTCPKSWRAAGCKYYYHCRGDEDRNLYRWLAPSGRSILVYREPYWYWGYIEPAMALYAPAFCQQHGMDTMLGSTAWATTAAGRPGATSSACRTWRPGRSSRRSGSARLPSSSPRSRRSPRACPWSRAS